MSINYAYRRGLLLVGNRPHYRIGHKYLCGFPPVTGILIEVHTHSFGNNILYNDKLDLVHYCNPRNIENIKKRIERLN